MNILAIAILFTLTYLAFQCFIIGEAMFPFFVILLALAGLVFREEM